MINTNDFDNNAFAVNVEGKESEQTPIIDDLLANLNQLHKQLFNVQHELNKTIDLITDTLDEIRDAMKGSLQ